MSSGKLLVFVTPAVEPGQPPPINPPNPKIVRLNADGSLDGTYSAPDFTQVLSYHITLKAKY